MGLSSGQVLARRYRLGRRIAIGGMGEVWQAADTRLDRQVAVKVLKPELSLDAEFRHRFHTEARMTASLNHPGIAAVHDYGEATSGPNSADHVVAYLVMELVPGDPLDAILTRQRRLSAGRTLDMLRQAGDALQAAHDRGLVHRDIKPANILITPDGKVKLTDFGIARAVDAAPVTRTGMVMGTAHYIAPEQAAGDDAGPAADVYSLGVVGYECLAGGRPFSADNAVTIAMMHIRDQPPPLPPDVPPALCELIETALAKDPLQRYRTGGELAAAVAAIQAGHRVPLPTGLAGSGTTAALRANRPPPTALLPAFPPTRRPEQPYSERRDPQRERRGAGWVAVALLGVVALALGGYLARDVLRSAAAPAGVASGTAAGLTTVPDAPGTPPSVTFPSDPAPSAKQQPFGPEPTKMQPTPEPTDPGEAPPEVLIIPTDYWGHRGSDAVVTAKAHGLIPRVLDDNGDQVDPDLRSQCRIVGVDPLSGYVPRGSTLELTCREGK
ncbi:MAG: serine/threonine protein kinase [Pseudonocardiales bacterium]|nr:MAG: serine/threonine protein kinase [Pseudonocardiales bacterium]